MKLPQNATIAPEKMIDYLLKWQPDNDKSKFLELAGYTADNWQRLVGDIRKQILSTDAEPLRKTAYGDLFRIRGVLMGPNGATRRIVTIWIEENVSGKTKFVTLFPDKEV